MQLSDQLKGHMKMNTETTCCTKLPKVLVDVEVEADLSGMVYGYNTSLEDYANRLDKAATEFHDFLRDHRSQDMVCLTINRIRKDICSHCRNEWETDTDADGTWCASCGARVEDDQLKGRT